MSGQRWKDAQGTFQSDWAAAGLLGLAAIVILIIVLFAIGII